MPYSAEPLNPDMEAMSALNDAESRRARAWESVLLLGDPETVRLGVLGGMKSGVSSGSRGDG